MDKAKLKQAIEDYNNDSAGREVGRIRRFEVTHHINPASAKSDNFNTEMAFAVLIEAERQRQIEFQERMDGLRARYAELDEASLRALQEATRDLQDIRDRANRAKDGRRIYLSEEDGKHYDEEDNVVLEADIDRSNYDPNGPMRGAYKGLKSRFDSALSMREEAIAFGEEIESDKVDIDNVEKFEDRLERLESSLSGHGDFSSPSDDIKSAASHEQKGSLSSSLFFYRTPRRIGVERKAKIGYG